MSHFCVYVFHDENTSVNDLLSPYDENIKLSEPVVAYTKEEAIKWVRDNMIAWHQKFYDEYIKDPNAFEKKWEHNQSYINFIKNKFLIQKNWTDEQCYDYMKQTYEAEYDRYGEEISPSMIAENGDLLTTYNPNSKWDWYEEGGRWAGIIKNNNDTLENINLESLDIPFAFVTPDGEWIEKGQMGWFGMSSNNEDPSVWDKKFKEYVKSLPSNIILTQVDCHI